MREIEMNIGTAKLGAFLELPLRTRGLVIFAHGSGSSRHSPRNQYVANLLNEAGLGTLLADLLSEDESANRRNVFDICLLTDRLKEITTWATAQEDLTDLPIGLFGASTGAAAALSTAAALPELISSVVSRGGRPDLAEEDLARVEAPTLLIVGGKDSGVIELNRHALAKLECESRLEVIDNATHLFEEPGALDEVARLATDWFKSHLTPRGLGSRMASKNGLDAKLEPKKATLPSS